MRTAWALYALVLALALGAVGAFATAPEIALAVPLSGSLHAPAIWNERLVFLRHERIYTWTIGARKATVLSFPSNVPWKPVARDGIRVIEGEGCTLRNGC